MPEIRDIKDADIENKRTLVRVDFDVPIAEGRILDDVRIKAVIPTLELLHESGAAKITLIAHLGRPNGKTVESLRLVPVEARLRELTKVPFEMRENLRFDPREEANDENFAKELAALGDIYVNEAFADSHRAHASIVGVPKFLPSYAGLRFMKEVDKLREAQTPPVGSVAVIGGAKFETKEPLLRNLLSAYSQVLLGGALADDVLKARGMPVGESLVAEVGVPTELAGSERILVPADVYLEEEDDKGSARAAMTGDVRKEERIVDIGPSPAATWGQKISEAPFVLWNGPMGIYEEGYRAGTDALAVALIKGGARAIVGGGDTLAALRSIQDSTLKQGSSRPDLDEIEKSGRIFFSMGGGAMLKYLAEGTLPGLEALTRR